MHTVYVVVSIAELVLVAMLLVRVARRPSVSDRIVALNTISSQAAIAVLFFAAFADRVIYLDVSLTGVVGILRMPDVYTRIQRSSKTITMGALPMLVALAIAKGPVTSYGSRDLIVAVLLLVVNPTASHALARAAYKTGVPMWSGAVVDEPAHRRAEEQA